MVSDIQCTQIVVYWVIFQNHPASADGLNGYDLSAGIKSQDVLIEDFPNLIAVNRQEGEVEKIGTFEEKRFWALLLMGLTEGKSRKRKQVRREWAEGVGMANDIEMYIDSNSHCCTKPENGTTFDSFTMSSSVSSQLIGSYSSCF